MAIIRAMTRPSHAKPREKRSIDDNLLGPCGIYCGYCLAYKKEICLGCRYEADKHAKKGNLQWCTLLNCAESKGVEMCSECEEFPCKEYDPDGTGMFSWTYINYIKDEIKEAKASGSSRAR